MNPKKTLLAACLTALLAASPLYAAPLLGTPADSAAISIHGANAWMEIDVQAFEDNIRTLQKELDGKSQICAVMKADAYGNSIDLLMPTVIKTGIPCIGIASNEEARIIREHGYNGQIMRVRAATEDEIVHGMQYDMEELVGNYGQASRINELAQAAGKTLRIHIALNSGGMGRNGFDMTDPDIRESSVAVTKLPNLQTVGIMTHFAVEDADDVKRGLEAFHKESGWLLHNAELKRRDIILHAANSFATLAVPESRLDMVRPGGLLYGDSIPERTEYKKTFALKSRVATVNYYGKGSTVGYDRTFTLQRDSKLANLPIGYSDGYRRAFTNKGHVLIRGHKVPVVGKTSMNTTMVDVTDFPDIRAGDEAVLFGKQGESEITQAEIEEINGALLADLYTIWGTSNPRLPKSATSVTVPPFMPRAEDYRPIAK